MHQPVPEQPEIIWFDIAIILDAAAPAEWVEAVFDAVANRPLPLPDAARVARRIDLITCSGLRPRHPQYGHGLRLYDAARNLTVAEAIAECALTDPPPEMLVMVSDRAPTGPWVQPMATWVRQVQLCGRTPLRQHLVWGDHVADLDGFAPMPQELATIADLRAALAKLWCRPKLVLERPRESSGRRCCPPRRRVAKILKPYE